MSDLVDYQTFKYSGLSVVSEAEASTLAEIRRFIYGE